MSELNLTPNELAVLKGARVNNFCDAGDKDDGSPWVFAVIEYSKLDEKVARGVLSSLVKKGLVEIYDAEGRNKANDMYLIFTDKAFDLVAKGVI